MSSEYDEDLTVKGVRWYVEAEAERGIKHRKLSLLLEALSQERTAREAAEAQAAALREELETIRDYPRGTEIDSDGTIIALGDCALCDEFQGLADAALSGPAPVCPACRGSGRYIDHHGKGASECTACHGSGTAPTAGRERSGCPCTLIEPCSSGCTCANPVMSGGCRLCARYGSLEQRTVAARRLAGRERPEQTWEDSQKVGAAVNEIADRIMEGGFTGPRHSILRWLTWVSFIGKHPEAYREALEEGGDA